jgi:Flp pilus assembly pilin Flp
MQKSYSARKNRNSFSRGATAVEYALVLCCVVVMCGVGFRALGKAVAKQVARATAALQ